MACPICRAGDTVSCHDQVQDLEHGSGLTANFRACRNCGTLFQDPLPDRSRLRVLYGPDYRAQQRGGIYGALKLIQARLALRRFQAFIPRSDSRVLELGCGAGYLLSVLRQTGFTDLCGVDWTIAPELARSEPDIIFVEQDITAFTPSRPVDVILINNVIEHLSDPEALIGRCSSYLRPGGRIVLVTPNADSVSHDLFGRFWAGLHSPWHTFIFTAQSLSILTARLPVVIETIAGGEDPGGWGISVQNWLRGRLGTRPTATGYGPAAIAATLLCVPLAAIAQLRGKGSTLLAVLAAQAVVE